MLSFLSVQMCLLSSVEFLCLAWRNDAVWYIYIYISRIRLVGIWRSLFVFSLTKFIIYLTSPQYSYFWLTSSNAIICNAAIFSIIFHLYPCNQQLARSVALNNSCSGVRLYSMWSIVPYPMDGWPRKTINSAAENGIGTDGDTLVLWALNNLR